MKAICDLWRCGWYGDDSELYEFTDPDGDIIDLCPKCKSIISTVKYACAEEGCWELATCGTPTANGYKSTCGNHRPKKSEDKHEDD